MRIAFVAFSAPGHLNPTTALARQLQSRNHEAVIVSLPDAETYVRAAGLAFLPVAADLIEDSLGVAKKSRHAGPAFGGEPPQTGSLHRRRQHR
jgi:UDP:flavonoid glycosyltransferase YjiC (YdhE family)